LGERLGKGHRRVQNVKDRLERLEDFVEFSQRYIFYVKGYRNPNF